MSGQDSRYVIDPTRVVVRSGGDETEYVGLSLEIGEDGIVLRVRTGAFGREEIRLDYADLKQVGAAEDLSYRLELEGPDASYAVLNVTPSEDKIGRIVDYVQERIDRASTAAGGTTATAGTDRVGSSGDEGSGPDVSDESVGGSAAEELKRWVELNEEGIISDEELEEKKRKLL